MALTNILILKYNNYYNRIIKQEATLNDYITAGESYAEAFYGINFYKEDGVNTDVVLNTTKTGVDYLVEYDDQANILSRWFIIENMQTRAGQSRFSLHRDVIVDNKESILDATCYIEKATVNVTDVAIYNEEQISFNEIKTSETQLKDKSNIPWIVGYLPTDLTDKSITIPLSKYNLYGTYSTVNDFYSAIGYSSPGYKKVNEYKSISFRWNDAILSLKYGSISIPSNFTYEDTGSTSQYYGVATTLEKRNEMLSFFNDNEESIKTIINTAQGYKSSALPIKDGQVIFITGIGYKKVHIAKSTALENFVISDNASFTSLIQGPFPTMQVKTSGSSDSIRVLVAIDTFVITLEDISGEVLTFTIPATARRLNDAPYKMFAIPVGWDGDFLDAGGVGTAMFKMEMDVAKNMATQIGIECSAYDIQLLPYCPFEQHRFQKSVGNINYINGASWTKDVDYVEVLDSGDETVGIIYFAKQSSFTFDIDVSSLNLTLPTNSVDLKVVNQCNKYRLASPNYASIFDFNLVRTGSINKINVDCTYKPFSPYIHVNPVWSKLYGSDFDDMRGLICQGNFSLPIINDQWKQYEINNKNYLNAFNRQIDSIELQNKYRRISEGLNAFTGTAQGATSGAIAGSVAGPGGALAGGIIGGAASLTGGLLDLSINEKLRNDALDLTIDNFNYSLDNIRALPNTLSRVSSFDYNNKIFPLLEYYTCTDEEKDIFKNKMAFNGMTVMRVDNIANFIKEDPTYIKAKLIRINIGDDYHIVNTIADELNKGVYI